MLTRKGENVVRQQSGVSIEVVEPTSGEQLAKASGDLILTNQRVVFEQVTGMFSKKTTTVVDVGLDKVANVSVEGVFGKKLVLQIPMQLSASMRLANSNAAQMGTIDCRATFGVKEPLEWERAVREAAAG